MSSELDFDWRALTPQPVIGVDEVGRGCLAGPVYAAACWLRSEDHCELFQDSKSLSEIRREQIAPLIHSSHAVGIGFSTVEEIETINILQASLLAMKRAVESLCKEHNLREATVLIDGTFKIPGLDPKLKQVTLIKGDLRALPVSAASIVAKVTRDRLMKEWGHKYPGYDFEKNKGYGSPKHLAALQSHGPTPLHRKTFKGIKEFFEHPARP